MGEDIAVGGTIEDADLASGDREQTVSDTEADEMEEHLRGLGYLE